MISDTLTQNNSSMELLYFCDLKGEWLDFIYTFCQQLPGLVAGALVRYVLCGVVYSANKNVLLLRHTIAHRMG